MSAFWMIHNGLPREGPGDRASLEWAVRAAGLRADARICDAGCGPGADVPGLLAHVPRGRVHAVDLHPPFVAQLRTRFVREPRLQAEVADFTALAGPYDLIWSAGAVYAVGLEAALQAWRRALAPGGRVALSHLCWTGAARPPEAAAFWAEEYPDMADAAAAEATIVAAGWRIVARTRVSDAAWEAYYTPLAARLDALAPGAPDDPDFAAEIAHHRREIAVWRAHGDSFGYMLFLLAP